MFNPGGKKLYLSQYLKESREDLAVNRPPRAYTACTPRLLHGLPPAPRAASQLPRDGSYVWGWPSRLFFFFFFEVTAGLITNKEKHNALTQQAIAK